MIDRPTTRPTPPAWKHLILLMLAGVLLWGLTCGLWDLWGPDESRYVQIGKELLGRHNWFLLTLFGQPYDEKPPLPFWIFAGMIKLGGGSISTWLLRLPSVTAAVLTVALTYLIGRRRLGTRAGLLAALILMTSLQFIDEAPKAELNMMFTGWVTLALWAWLTRPPEEPIGWGRTTVFWVAMIGAFFIKGPVGLIFIVPAILGDLGWGRAWREAAPLRQAPGLLLWLGAIKLWFYLQAEAVGNDFVSSQIADQTVGRFLHGTHGEPFWFYFVHLPFIVFAPWGLLLFPLGWRLWRQRRPRPGEMMTTALPASLRPLLAWTLCSFVFLSLSAGKRDTYPLPMLPGLALLTGWFLDQLSEETNNWRWSRRTLAWVEMAAGLALLGAAGVLLARPALLTRYGLGYAPAGLTLMALGGLGAAGLGLWTLRRAAMLPTQVLSLAGLLLMLGLVNYAAVNPVLNPRRTERPLALKVDQLLRERSEPAIGAIGRAAKADFYVYGGYAVLPFELDEAFLQPESLPGLLAGRQDDWAKLADEPQKAGYRKIYQDTGEPKSDKQLMIYARPRAPLVLTEDE